VTRTEGNAVAPLPLSLSCCHDSASLPPEGIGALFAAGDAKAIIARRPGQLRAARLLAGSVPGAGGLAPQHHGLLVFSELGCVGLGPASAGRLLDTYAARSFR